MWRWEREREKEEEKKKEMSAVTIQRETGNKCAKQVKEPRKYCHGIGPQAGKRGGNCVWLTAHLHEHAHDFDRATHISPPDPVRQERAREREREKEGVREHSRV